MKNKFENEKPRRKNAKGPPWYRTFHKTEHLIESLFILIYLKSSICLSTVYLCCLLIWTRLKQNFFDSFAKKKKHSSSHQTLICLEFWNMPTTHPNLDRLFLSNHSSTNSCVMETAQEMTRTSQNQRGAIFHLPHHLPPGLDRFKQFPTPGSEKLDLSLGYPRGW